ncbi:MAG: GrpB family protein [Candidatus Ozemobacteraceae bacterium]
MKKPLFEMTLEELWQLFPIVLSEHKACWAIWYNNEKARITDFLQIPEARISHIGSTAVRNIWAKPIVDIMVEIPETISPKTAQKLITENGYILMSESERRKSFNRGYTPEGFAERVFHLHLRHFGDNNELYFCDYLIDNPHIAKEYEALKLSLWQKYEHNRNAYTDAKTDFIEKHTTQAKIRYKNRYAQLKAGN